MSLCDRINALDMTLPETNLALQFHVRLRPDSGQERRRAGQDVWAQVDIAENRPDTRIDFIDISWAVAAFRGWGYPFDGPVPCK